MKVFSKRKVKKENLMRFIYIEKKIMALLEHPFLVKLHFAFQTQRKLYLLMDFCPNRDLGYYLKRNKRLPENEAKYILAEVILGIDALHSQDIIHRDLKPDNLLIDDEGHILLTDYGLAKEGIKKGVLTRTFCG
jgi:serine/threonine protein kinase